MGQWPGGVPSTWTLGLVLPLSKWGPGRASSVLSECGLRGQPGEAVGAAHAESRMAVWLCAHVALYGPSQNGVMLH